MVYFSTLQTATTWILSHGYPLMFVVMLLEGPVVTAAGSFAAALGYFNIGWILVLSILGNLIPDVVYYALGYFGRDKFVNKYGKYFGLTHDKIEYVENLLKTHPIKSLFIIKLVPFLATPGLIVVGLTKMDIRKYITWSLIITIPSSVLYLVLGYYFGAAYDHIVRYFNIGVLLLIIFVIIIFIVIKLQNRLYKKLVKE